jgi:hypothetical protein
MRYTNLRYIPFCFYISLLYLAFDAYSNGEAQYHSTNSDYFLNRIENRVRCTIKCLVKMILPWCISDCTFIYSAVLSLYLRSRSLTTLHLRYSTMQ